MRDSRGFLGILLIIIVLISGIVAGIYLLLQRTNFLPQAAFQNKDASYSIRLFDPKFPSHQNDDSFILVPPESEFTVSVLLTSGEHSIKSLSSHIIFPNNLIKVTSIDASSYGAIPLNWIDQSFDNDLGLIVLSGNTSSDGFLSPPDQTSLLARISFQVLPNIAGRITKIDFLEEKTYMVRKADDSAVKKLIKRPLEVRISLIKQ